MKRSEIKKIPKDIRAKISCLDKNWLYENRTRYYAYLDIFANELVKVTVAAKTNRNTNRLCLKQVAIHGVNGTNFAKDMQFTWIAGYQVNWDKEFNNYKNDWCGKWCEIENNYFNPDARLVNLEFLGQTVYKHCGFYICKELDVIEFIKIWQEHPNVEYLAKMGLLRFAYKKSIVKKCEKDKKFCAFLRKNAFELSNQKINSKVLMMAYNKNIDLQKALHIENLNITIRNASTNSKNFRETFEKSELPKFIHYIESQKISINGYLDYLNACISLKIDMSDTKNRYPYDFKHWHDVRTDEYHTQKAIQDKKARQELYAKFSQVVSKYEKLQQNKKSEFVVIIAKSPYDLIVEGKSLHHCVGNMNYDQKMIKEESLIFFIRKVYEQNTPFVTIEYSPSKRKVLQCYAKNNTQPDEQTKDFVYNEWQPFANKQISIIKKIVA